ncbi:hypothetical protein BGX31_002668 [Mortierella sp. GBA43]|nr:hypothetical protein BGX31_002668 [Mortierella sp. GBA43]
MHPSAIRLAAVAHARTPLIKFLGPRSALPEVHHEAGRHPAAPQDAAFPLKAATPGKASSSKPSKAQGGSKQILDYHELPARYRHPVLTEAEIEAVEVTDVTF